MTPVKRCWALITFLQSLAVLVNGVGQNCTSNDDCPPANYFCDVSLRICTCNASGFDNESTCNQKVGLGGPCTETRECLDQHSNCTDSACVCDTGYFRSGNFCQTNPENETTASFPSPEFLIIMLVIAAEVMLLVVLIIVFVVRRRAKSVDPETSTSEQTTDNTCSCLSPRPHHHSRTFLSDVAQNTDRTTDISSENNHHSRNPTKDWLFQTKCSCEEKVDAKPRTFGDKLVGGPGKHKVSPVSSNNLEVSSENPSKGAYRKIVLSPKEASSKVHPLTPRTKSKPRKRVSFGDLLSGRARRKVTRNEPKSRSGNRSSEKSRVLPSHPGRKKRRKSKLPKHGSSAKGSDVQLSSESTTVNGAFSRVPESTFRTPANSEEEDRKTHLMNRQSLAQVSMFFNQAEEKKLEEIEREKEAMKTSDRPSAIHLLHFRPAEVINRNSETLPSKRSNKKIVKETVKPAGAAARKGVDRFLQILLGSDETFPRRKRRSRKAKRKANLL